MNNETRTDIDAAPPGYVGLTEPVWKRRARNWKRAAHAQRDLFRAVDGNRIAAEREIERLNTRIAELEAALAATADAPPSTNSGEVSNKLVVGINMEMVEMAAQEAWMTFFDDGDPIDVEGALLEFKNEFWPSFSAALSARKDTE